MRTFHILPAAFLPAILLIAGCAGGAATDQPAAQQTAARETPEFDADAMVRVADNLRASGDHMSALNLYARARERDSDNVAALLGEGESLLAVGIPGEAERRYRTALQKGGGARAEAGIARALMQQGRAEEALPHFDAAVAAGGASAQILNHYGVALDLLARHEEAQVQYGKGLDLAPNDPGLLNNLALSFALGGNFDTAVRLLSGLVTETPDAADARSNLALVYGLSGDFEAAEALIALNEQERLQDPGTGRHQMAYIRQVAALPPKLRPRAIILGLEAAMPRIHEQETAAEPMQAPEPSPEPAPARADALQPVPEAPQPAAEAQRPAAPEPAPVAEAQETEATAAADEAPADPAPVTQPPATQPPAAVAAAAPHGVQLGAYPSLDVALHNWPKIRERAPELFEGRAAYAWPRGEIVRLMIAVPEGAAAASRFCAELAGKEIDCLARPFDPAQTGSTPVQEGVE